MRPPTRSVASVGIESGVGVVGRSSGNGADGDDMRDTSSSSNNGDCPYPLSNGVHSRLCERFLSMVRAVGNTMLRPFRALWAAFNDWATGSYDEVFLQQLMERMEAEQEAAKENPKERAGRLKDAFVKAGTVLVRCYSALFFEMHGSEALTIMHLTFIEHVSCFVGTW